MRYDKMYQDSDGVTYWNARVLRMDILRMKIVTGSKKEIARWQRRICEANSKSTLSTAFEKWDGWLAKWTGISGVNMYSLGFQAVNY